MSLVAGMIEEADLTRKAVERGPDEDGYPAEYGAPDDGDDEYVTDPTEAMAVLAEAGGEIG